ncbi:phosphate/phosphite/phosphonate ABC transporter substrate-binding protein [Shewanella waksmanii]|uniref:phosphate/phosphite/phosphonate ABC transporter substrate-binding protein n=1 Tax=Shewanella waksmanii TaxID=213783 RepID=UPI003734CDF0
MKQIYTLLLGLAWLLLIPMVIAGDIGDVDSRDEGNPHSDKPTIVFGVVPQQAASTLARKWSPLLNELSQRLPYQLQFATAPDIPTFEQRLAQGLYDVAYMNPYHYVVFHEPPTDYVALAKERDKKLAGIIVVQKQSPITDISQLAGQTIAFPAPAAFAASVIPRASLKQAKIDIASKYVGSHDSVYLAVSQGLVSAGGGVGRTFNNMPQSVRDQLRILWKTDGYTPHAFATHPRISIEQRQSLLNALLDIGRDDHTASLLKSLDFRSLEAANDSDWDDVRALSLGELSQPLQGQ